MKILITGATGMIGSRLGQVLVEKGHEIIVISRNSKARLQIPYPCEVVVGDLSAGPIHDEKLRRVEAVFHLAGENVGETAWTPERKTRILESRAVGTGNLWASLKGAPIRQIIASSAVGYYGDAADQLLTEDFAPGTGFLAEVCQRWEAALNAHHFAETQQSVVRFGVVLDACGGALDKMLPLFRRGLGAPLGSGDQWMSWIHLSDAVKLLVWLFEQKQSGVFNGVAPEAVSNKRFSQELAQTLGVICGPSVPKFVLKTVLGEQADMVLFSQRASSEKLEKAGFRFHFPTLKQAFESVFEGMTDGDELYRAEQYIDAPIEKVFQFFSDAYNLERITPPFLNFKINSVSSSPVVQGTLIEYSLKIHGVPISWRTEISRWEPPHVFTDEQQKGPYSKWHHTHYFKPMGRGTLMSDKVYYRLPVGFLGRFFGLSLVRKDVSQIFSYRRQSVADIQF